jgi:hypothetical protein
MAEQALSEGKVSATLTIRIFASVAYNFRLFCIFASLPAVRSQCEFETEAFGGGVHPRHLPKWSATLQTRAHLAQFLCFPARFDPLAPIGGARNRPVAEQRRQRPVAQRIAAPRPLAGALGQFRPERVCLDISKNRQQMRILLNGKALETSLIQVSADAVVVVLAIALDVGVGDPRNEAGEIAVGVGPEDQMPVIWHQTEPEETAWRALQCLTEDFQEGVVIRRLMKDSRPPVGAVKDVIHNPTRRQPSGPSHESKT